MTYKISSINITPKEPIINKDASFNVTLDDPSKSEELQFANWVTCSKLAFEQSGIWGGTKDTVGMSFKVYIDDADKIDTL